MTIRYRIVSASLFFALVGFSPGDVRTQTAPGGTSLQQLSRELKQRWDARRSPLYFQLRQSNVQLGPEVELMGIDANNRPIYYTTDNIVASATTNTQSVWPSGGYGFSLTGSETESWVLGLWDQGLANQNHVELVGRVTYGEAYVALGHATHVGGTMIASGVNPLVKGMSYEGQLITFNWTDDTVEMAGHAADGLQISNHSYGLVGGWNGLQWYGDVTLGTHEDWRFGFYNDLAAEWDQVAFQAPLYLIVKSSGNDRNDVEGTTVSYHQHYENGGWVNATDYHPPDGYPFGFDTITDVGCAKNILTVGAVKDIPGSYTQPSDVVQTAFSSWGPTDDGRIKPDIVANGDSVYSCETYPNTNTSYAYKSGTSMAAPNASGSINLLRELYENTHAHKPRSATLKAIVIHTADEAGGANGPDYSNGWGLLNTGNAANIIAASPSDDMGYVEDLTFTGNTDEHYFDVWAPGDVRVTMVWTDPPGTPPVYVIDPVAKMLVNDLDVRLVNTSTNITYYPWRLDGNNPLGVASKGDNNTDNVERIDAYNVTPGSYVVRVTNKGTITYGEQLYSLVWSGMEMATSTGVGPSNRTPRLSLTARPNPAAGFTSLEYSLEEAGPVTIEMYDARGRLVRTVMNGDQPAGAGSVRIDTSDLSSGVYFVRMDALSQRVVHKVTIVR